MTTCPLCGCLIGDAQTHVTWHAEREDLRPEDLPYGENCMFDGAPVSYASSNGTASTTQWACGHTITLREPSGLGGGANG